MSSHRLYQPITSAVRHCNVTSNSATPGEKQFSQQCIDNSMARTRFVKRTALPPRAGELPSKGLVESQMRELNKA